MATRHSPHRTDEMDIEEILNAAHATPAELARRREVIARIHRLREEIGPIDIRADDLLHLAENEE
jgi:hypothetical protein